MPKLNKPKYTIKTKPKYTTTISSPNQINITTLSKPSPNIPQPSLWNQNLVNLSFDDNKTKFRTNEYISTVIRQKDFQNGNYKNKIKLKEKSIRKKDLKNKCFSRLKFHRISL